MNLTKKEVANRFRASVDSYDASSDFHTTLAKCLVQSWSKYKKASDVILEIGVHTGLLTHLYYSQLSKQNRLLLLDMQTDGMRRCRFGDTTLIQADGEKLPFKKGCVDIALSGATFQWFENWDQSLLDLILILKPKGHLIFTQFIQPSLEPLKTAFMQVNRDGSFLQLQSESMLKKKCMAMGRMIDFKICEEKMYFDSLSDLINYLRTLGVTASANYQSPMSTTDYKTILKEMESLREKKGIPLVFKAALVVLQK